MGWRHGSSIQLLLCKCEALSSNPSTTYHKTNKQKNLVKKIKTPVAHQTRLGHAH
jgi:hypothetical protein